MPEVSSTNSWHGPARKSDGGKMRRRIRVDSEPSQPTTHRKLLLSGCRQSAARLRCRRAASSGGPPGPPPAAARARGRRCAPTPPTAPTACTKEQSTHIRQADTDSIRRSEGEAGAGGAACTRALPRAHAYAPGGVEARLAAHLPVEVVRGRLGRHLRPQCGVVAEGVGAGGEGAEAVEERHAGFQGQVRVVAPGLHLRRGLERLVRDHSAGGVLDGGAPGLGPCEVEEAQVLLGRGGGLEQDEVGCAREESEGKSGLIGPEEEECHNAARCERTGRTGGSDADKGEVDVPEERRRRVKGRVVAALLRRAPGPAPLHALALAVAARAVGGGGGARVARLLESGGQAPQRERGQAEVGPVGSERGDT